MEKALMVTLIRVTSLLCAEPVLNLKQIEVEMKIVKDEARFRDLLKLMGDTQPKTEEDIIVLGRLMDRFPNQGQKAVLKIKDPNLAKSIIKECRRKIEKCEKFMKKYPSEEVREKLPRDEMVGMQQAFMHVRVLMWELGELDSKEAVPFLRQYLKTDISPNDDDSFYGTLRFFASEAIDKIDEGIPLSELVKQLDAPNITNEDKAKIIKQISLSKDSEKKIILKELSVEHKDKDVRFRCAATLGELIATNPEESDMEYIYQRLPNSVSNAWSSELRALKLYTSRNSQALEKKYMPILIDIVKKGTDGSNRANAAEILGVYKMDESIACLEACVRDDQIDYVRTACKKSYQKLVEDK